MLKDIQIKIVLIFLIIGAIIIGALGYINYASLQPVIDSAQNIADYDTTDLIQYQANIKVITLCAIFIFSLICILVRNFCYQKNYFTNCKTY